METVEQGLRRIFKNAPHIYAEAERCAKERPDENWSERTSTPLRDSHRWGKGEGNGEDFDYWMELNEKVEAGGQIGADYPLPPDSPLRKREVGNWYKFTDESKFRFTNGEWYKCIKPTTNDNAFINDYGNYSGFCPNNHLSFDLTNPLPHNPETNPMLEEIGSTSEMMGNPTLFESESEGTLEVESELVSKSFKFSQGVNSISLMISFEEKMMCMEDQEKSISSFRFDKIEQQIINLKQKIKVLEFAKKVINEEDSETALESENNKK